jgi:DNA-binding GntR family transcriptional regulator
MTHVGLDLRPIDLPSLKSRTYEALKAAILEMNIYDANAQLRLDERALALKFGVSRTPLREALAQLEQEGLVKTLPRRGVFITRRTKTEIVEMITVWAAIESMAARLAAEIAADEDLAKLHGLVDTFSSEDVDSNMGEYSDANIRFHTEIIRLSGCKLIADIANGLFVHVRAIRRRTIFEKDRARRSIVDHKEIVEALEARNPERAERLVREHTMMLRAHVEQFVKLD